MLLFSTLTARNKKNGSELCTMISVSYSVKTGISLIIKALTPYYA